MSEVRPMLEIERLEVAYGAIRALKGVSLRVEEGEIVTLIGANGAGKSSLLRAISGIVKAKSGSILLWSSRAGGRRDDRAQTDLVGLAAHEIVAAGVCQVPEGRGIFANMTVAENLDLGAYLRRDRAGIQEDRARVFALFPRLAERLGQRGGTLSGGEQQMLAIARALMARPRLLLLDEPSLGIAPVLTRAIFKTIREINGMGMTILLVEQNAHLALQVASRGYVLETGSIVLEGTAKELLGNEDVRKAYLGG